MTSAFVPATALRLSPPRPTTTALGRRRQPPPTPHYAPIRARTRQAPQAVWVKSSATIEVEANRDMAYDVYSDIKEMPNWSPWLQEVRVDPNDGMLSEWVLFSRGITISWKARITANQRGEQIAWSSISGLRNRGSVRFADGAAKNATAVTLAIEFDVPSFLARSFDNAFIGRFVRETLASDLKRFRGAVLRSRRLQRIQQQQAG